jgi:hypothetical protein
VHERRPTRERVEEVLDTGPNGPLGRALPARRTHRVQGASEVEQVGSFRLVELQGTGERFEHAG